MDFLENLIKRYRIEGRNEYGINTGRRRYMVMCLECGKILHEATTGPRHYIDRHEKEQCQRIFDMTPKEFMKGVLVTEPSPDNFNDLGISDIRLLHASLGMATEAGELLDQIKKHLFYGKEIDRVNLIEEAGDILWYMGVLLDELDVSFEKVMQINHDKLAKRYGEKFSSEAALNRDLKAERKVLEND